MSVVRFGGWWVALVVGCQLGCGGRRMEAAVAKVLLLLGLLGCLQLGYPAGCLPYHRCLGPG